MISEHILGSTGVVDTNTQSNPRVVASTDKPGLHKQSAPSERETQLVPMGHNEALFEQKSTEHTAESPSPGHGFDLGTEHGHE